MMKAENLFTAKAQVSAVASAGGLLALVDWKGHLVLLREGEPIVVQAHRDRAQGVAILDDRTVVTAGFDNALRLFDSSGAPLGQWIPSGSGKGFQRFHGVRGHGQTVFADHQDAGTAQVFAGTVRGNTLEMTATARTSAMTEGQPPGCRTISFTPHGAAWLSVDQVVELPFEGGEERKLAELPRFTRSAALGARGLVYVEGQQLVLPNARVPLQRDDFYPLAVCDERVAVKAGADLISVFSWAGARVAEGKHNQCVGLCFEPDGRLLSWGWDKKVRRWSVR